MAVENNGDVQTMGDNGHIMRVIGGNGWNRIDDGKGIRKRGLAEELHKASETIDELVIQV
jgi:hypothetical protein